MTVPGFSFSKGCLNRQCFFKRLGELILISHIKIILSHAASNKIHYAVMRIYKNVFLNFLQSVVPFFMKWIGNHILHFCQTRLFVLPPKKKMARSGYLEQKLEKLSFSLYLPVHFFGSIFDILQYFPMKYNQFLKNIFFVKHRHWNIWESTSKSSYIAVNSICKISH